MSQGSSLSYGRGRICNCGAAALHFTAYIDLNGGRRFYRCLQPTIVQAIGRRAHAFVHSGTWISMGVYSDGSYGIPAGLIYSFPVTCEKGVWLILQGLKIDEFSRDKMDATAKELVEKKSLAYSCLN